MLRPAMGVTADLIDRQSATMIATETVPSSLIDLRGIPLDEMPVLDSGVIDGVIKRILPEAPDVPATAAAFQSAI